MSVSKWRYTEECNGRPCPGDCDHCSFEPADLISRADAIEAVVAWTVEDRPHEVMPTDLVERIKALPSADAVQGEWKCMGDCGVTECDQCGWSIEEYVGDYNYCPNCGAKMKGGNDV